MGTTLNTGGVLTANVNNVNTTLYNNGNVTGLSINNTGNNTLVLNNFDATITGADSLTLNANGNINASAFTGELIVNTNSAISITGGTGDDYITGGNNAANTINGGSGSDVLTGGVGDGGDIFVFSDAPGAGVDLITDFGSAVDVIQLSLADFAGLGVVGAALSEANFFSAANVDDVNLATANAYVLYDSASGALYYDATGNATAGDAIQFAQIGLTDHASLTATNFFLIA